MSTSQQDSTTSQIDGRMIKSDKIPRYTKILGSDKRTSAKDTFGEESVEMRVLAEGLGGPEVDGVWSLQRDEELVQRRCALGVTDDLVFLFTHFLLPYFVDSWESKVCMRIVHHELTSLWAESKDELERSLSSTSALEQRDTQCNASLNTRLQRRTENKRKQSKVGCWLDGEKSEGSGAAPPSWRVQDTCDELVCVTFVNANRYEGRISRKLPEGHGCYVWADGASYEGEWEAGRATGRGLLRWPDFSWYEGETCSGFRHGAGTFLSDALTAAYVGEWRTGRREGRGVLYIGSAQDDFYEGDWRDDTPQGQGLRLHPDGAAFVGTWQRGRRHGHGTIVWPNAHMYRGSWADGTMSGFGVYATNAFFNNQLCFLAENTFHGAWCEGRKNGVGALEAAAGGIYYGWFEDGHKHGAGVVVCGDGSVVMGDPIFAEDRPVKLVPDSEDRGETRFSCLHCCKAPTGARLRGGSCGRQARRHTTGRQDVKSYDHTGAAAGSIHAANRSLAETKLLVPSHVPFNRPDHLPDLSYHLDRWYDHCWAKKNGEDLEEEKGLSEAMKMDVTSTAKEVPKTDTRSSKRDFPVFYTYVHSRTKRIAKSQANVSSLRAVEGGTKVRAANDKRMAAARKEAEGRRLRRAVLRWLPALRRICSLYASCASQRLPPAAHPQLARLQWWQLLRDCELPGNDVGISLAQVDQALANNPSALTASAHAFFERLRLWQVLHALLEVAWLRYVRPCARAAPPGLAEAFHRLMSSDVLPGAGRCVGNALFTSRDLLPLRAAYALYCSVGEPLSLRQLLLLAIGRRRRARRQRHSFLPVSSSVAASTANAPIYKLHRGDFPHQVVWGCNVVVAGANVSYLEGAPFLFDGTSSAEGVECVAREDSGEAAPDSAFPSATADEKLRALTPLGVRGVAHCLAHCCSALYSHGFFCNIDYEMTFLELVEVLLVAGRCLARDAHRRRQLEESSARASRDTRAISQGTARRSR